VPVTAPAQLQVLGPPRLMVDGEERLARRRKELSLLACLALRGRPVSRAWLAAAFWGEREEERARHSLRQTLVRLRDALPGVIVVDGEQASLAPGAVAVDAAAFEADVAAGRWAAAVERWRGEPLAGCDAAGGEGFATWLDGERARLGALHAAALRRLADDALDGARWTDAAAWAERWAEARPLDAAAAAASVRALSLAGRGEQAAARHAQISARWRDALGAEPPAEWRALGESLARARPAAASVAVDASPSAALSVPDRVGRGDDFAALRDAWSRAAAGAGVAAVVEGEPGSGRTRLCADFAASVAERGEAWVCTAHGSGSAAAGPWSAARELLAGLERAPGLGGAADWALAETARLVPTLRERFRALPPPAGDDAVLAGAVARVLADVAAEVPVLVHADDADAADECSRRLLLALARRPPAGVMVLLAGGAGELDVPGALRRVLRPLSPGETETLVAGMTDLPAEERARLARRVHADSAGNPGRAVERVRALADDGTLARGGDGGWTLASIEAEASVPAVLADAWSFVARGDELRRLEEALDGAAAGAGRVCWIAGEAGIGKTALLRELGRRARRRHPALLVASGECDAYAGPGSPYLPFRELWRAVRQAEPAAEAEADPFAPAPAGGSIDERCTGAFRRVAAARPLLLVVDDAQWADAASVGLLFHLVRRIADVPLLLVVAYRDTDLAAGGERHPLAGVVAEWERLFGGAGLALRPLREPDGARLVDALLDGGASGLSAEFRDALLRHTEGHPLFVVEAVRDLQARGVIVQGSDGGWREAGVPDWGALPARVEGVIGERVRRLGAEQRRLLAVAAVEGEVFTAEAAAAVLGVEPREVVRRLGELGRVHRLVAPHALRRLAAGTASEYRFRHSLFHRHACTLTDPAEARYLHADVGAALERLYGADSAEAAPRLARHFAEARDEARAGRYLYLAGGAAAQSGAHDSAADLFRRALEHAARAGDAELQARIREAAADVTAAAGDADAADAEYRALVAVAVDAGTRARLLRKQGDTLQARQRMEPALEAYTRAEAALFEAAEWASADFAEWAQLQVGRARALLLLNRMGELQELVRAVKDGVERYGRQRTAVLATLLRELSRRERLFGLDALVAACRRFAAEAEGPGRLREQAGAEFTIGFTQLWRGRLDDAGAHLSAALAVAEEGGEAWRQVLCCTYLALVQRLRGDVDGTVAWTSRAREAGDLLAGAAGMAHANHAWAALRAGDPRRASADASTALALWAGISPTDPFQWAARWPLLAVALGEGDVGDAIGHARAMLDPEQHPLPDALSRPLALAVESWERGDADRARTHLDAALSAARANGYA
jgi:predicted ATPase/DNA-binding SARP family transcriptional activator